MSTHNYVLDDFFDVVRLKMCFYAMHPPGKASDFGTKCLFWRYLATLVLMPSGQFSTFLYTMAQWKKTFEF